MTSRFGETHLDLDVGREVVFCHACSREWYRDDYGLMCPNCESEITEILSPDNDPRQPRQMDGSSAPTSPELSPSRHADDSDPDEADIEDLTGPHGLRFRRSIRSDPDDSHHDTSIDPVLHRFQDMVQSLGSPRRDETLSLFGRPDIGAFASPRIHRTTFTSGTLRGGASITILSSPIFTGSRAVGDTGEAGDESTHPDNIDPFQTIFSNIIRDLGPPDETDEGGPQSRIVRSLREILNQFNPANAILGDAVYSQEALDRIVTQLFEANSQSNAAPGASNEAITKLKRKIVDEELIGPEARTECSICIDVVKEGEVATFLPCKHWFHDVCIVPWLKQHNTCPVCRSPIDKMERGQENDVGANVTSGAGASGSRNNPPHSQSPTSPASFSHNNTDQPRGSGSSGADTPTGRAAADMVFSANLDPHSRPSNPTQSRLNEALRSVVNIQRERDHNRRDRSTTTGPSDDTSRMQRRTSHSPPSPRASNLAEQGARMRQRSPSENDRRGNGEREPRRSVGALNWLRERLAGGNGNGGSGSGGNHGPSQSGQDGS